MTVIDHDRVTLARVALGRTPAEVYIEGADLLNVFTGEIIRGLGIAVFGGRIAYVGPSRGMVSEETRIIQAAGKLAVPGYIDPHAHADQYLTPHAFAEGALPLGTTSVLTSLSDFAMALGEEGIRAYLRAVEELPLRFYVALPLETQETLGRSDRLVDPDRWAGFLLEDRVRSISEVVRWREILDEQPVMLRHLRQARAQGKRIDGHTNGAKLEALNALASAGVSSCHEAMNANELVARLRLGYYVMLRHGSILRSYPSLIPGLLKLPDALLARVMLTPDWISPSELMELGYMDWVIAEAIRFGLSPVRAYQMATIVPAIYLGLDEEIGSISPGRSADILLLEDLLKPRPVWVMARGRVVAEGERLTAGLGQWRWDEALRVSDRWFPVLPATAAAFEVRAGSKPTGKEGTVAVPALNILSKTVTDRVEVEVGMNDGRLVLRPGDGLLKISVLSANGLDLMTMFLKGFGLRAGALAGTVGLDGIRLVVIGRTDEEMALAVNELYRIGGGVVVVEGSEVLARLPLEIGGGMSMKSVTEAAADWRSIEQALRGLGCQLESPLVTLQFITGPLPFVRPTPRGLVGIKTGTVLFP